MTAPTLVNTLRYDPTLCVGCGLCGTVCPHGVFSESGNPAALLHPERCMECGACSLNCPTAAIAVDAGVGCAHALMKAVLFGGKEGCGCGGPDSTCCR